MLQGSAFTRSTGYALGRAGGRRAGPGLGFSKEDWTRQTDEFLRRLADAHRAGPAAAGQGPNLALLLDEAYEINLDLGNPQLALKSI